VTTLLLSFLLPLVPIHAGAATLGSPGDGDEAALIAAAEDVLTRRCVPCHAPGSEEEKALRDWDCADDLAATLAVEQLIVPGDPEDSDLFLTVDEGDMPPEDWEGGPCTPEEVEALGAWISAGAPLPAPAVGQAPEPKPPGAPPTPAPRRNPWLKWLGKLHPVVVHFPIALLVIALLADLLGRRPAARFCLGFGALGALAAAGLGWLAGESTPGTKADQLFLHRWSGIAVAALALVTWALYQRRTREGGPSEGHPGWVRWLLVALALSVSLAGHWGGELSWGEGYLTPPW
jgi:uncharacterized membrane protein